MKIAVLGAGSLGSVIGGRLAQSGHDVALINRNAAYVEAVQRNGLVLTEATRRETISLTAVRTPKGLGPVDLAIVLVKSLSHRNLDARRPEPDRAGNRRPVSPERPGP